MLCINILIKCLCDYSFHQHVNYIKRQTYLLHLVLIHFQSYVTAKITLCIHNDNHHEILVNVDVNIISSKSIRTKIDMFQKINLYKLI